MKKKSGEKIFTSNIKYLDEKNIYVFQKSEHWPSLYNLVTMFCLMFKFNMKQHATFIKRYNFMNQYIEALVNILN